MNAVNVYLYSETGRTIGYAHRLLEGYWSGDFSAPLAHSFVVDYLATPEEVREHMIDLFRDYIINRELELQHLRQELEDYLNE